MAAQRQTIGEDHTTACALYVNSNSVSSGDRYISCPLLLFLCSLFILPTHVPLHSGYTSPWWACPTLRSFHSCFLPVLSLTSLLRLLASLLYVPSLFTPSFMSFPFTLTDLPSLDCLPDSIALALYRLLLFYHFPSSLLLPPAIFSFLIFHSLSLSCSPSSFTLDGFTPNSCSTFKTRLLQHLQ